MRDELLDTHTMTEGRVASSALPPGHRGLKPGVGSGGLSQGRELCVVQRSKEERGLVAQWVKAVWLTVSHRRHLLRSRRAHDRGVRAAGRAAVVHAHTRAEAAAVPACQGMSHSLLNITTSLNSRFRGTQLA